jgi:hypothetical protein
MKGPDQQSLAVYLAANLLKFQLELELGCGASAVFADS